MDPRARRLTQLLAALSDPAEAGRLPDDAASVELARRHRLAPLLSAKRGDALPAGLAQAFRRDRIETIGQNLILAQAAEECVTALSAAGIPTILLKGLDYETRLYGEPGVRPMADVDLLVPAESRRAAFQVLDRAGFEPRAAAPGFDDPDYHEVAWRRGSLEVDLHLALAPLARCRIDYRAVWHEAEPVRVGQASALVLARPHAAVFHAVHMAIDHFDVPALALVDLARLLSLPEQRAEALDLAGRWRCRRPLATSFALAAGFIPGWVDPLSPGGFVAQRVAASYAAGKPVARPEQLLRKLLHFDAVSDACRYLAIQSRRNVRELVHRRLLRRSARERLAL